MALAAKLGAQADADSRQAERARLRIDASLGQSDATAIDVVVHDLSVHGFLAQTEASLPIGTEVWLELAGTGRLGARIRWRGSSTVGCEFETPIPPQLLAVALNESRVVWPNFPTSRSAPRAEPRSSPRLPEPAAGTVSADDRWPFWQRVAFILGSSVLLWSMIIVAIRATWAVVA